MKMLKTLAACLSLLVSGQAFAKTTPIKFAKGSSCGSFSGNAKGRTFTLQLNADQHYSLAAMIFMLIQEKLS